MYALVMYYSGVFCCNVVVPTIPVPVLYRVALVVVSVPLSDVGMKNCVTAHLLSALFVAQTANRTFSRSPTSRIKKSGGRERNGR